ncbi:MAG: Ger(x)C family spore germination protein [Syntrophomonadaceae bacterium]|nr:Ger(x)C family spore germination protein [Syntrophomonadaceae bacterium]
MKSIKKAPMCRKNRWRRLTVLALLPVLLFNSGCWNQVEVVNTVEAVGMFFDIENGQPLLGLQLAEPASSQSGTQPKKPINVYSAGATFSEAARRVMLDVPRLPMWSHVGVMLMGIELTQTDLAMIADFLARNRNVRKTSFLFVAEGNSKDFLEAELPIETYPILGLRKLIRIQEQQTGIYKPVTVDDFLQALAEPGVEPTAPQVVVNEVDGKKVLGLHGTAVFRERRQVGMLDEQESMGFRLMNPGMVTGGLFTFPPPGEEAQNKYISIELTRSLAKVKPQIEGNHLKKININIDAEGNFYEQNFAGNMISLENIGKIEAATDEEMQKRVMAAVGKAQSLQSDIFGWGRMIRQQDPSLWANLAGDWPLVFSGLEVEVTVNFAIRRTYLLDQSFEYLE